MDPISKNPGMPKKSRLDMLKKYRLAPQYSIPEGVANRKELLKERRKIAKTSIVDASRDLEEPIKKVISPKEQYKQKILEWKQKKENQKKEPAKKLKPFLTGTVQVPLCYVPPPPMNENKQKDKVAKTKGGGCNKQVSNIPKISESNLTKSKKYQLIYSKTEKYQSVSKISQPKSQAGPNYKSKYSTKKGLDKQIGEKVISEEDATIAKFETQLNSEVDRILKTCALWDTISKKKTLPGFVQELVLGATGQARLLVSQKMSQFRSLIKTSKKQNCPGKSGAARVSTQDLHGFWDLINLQVKDIDKHFSKLEQLKANNWKEENSNENKKPSKKGCTKPAAKFQMKPTPKSLIRELILQAKMKMTNKHPGNEEAGVETREAGSFTIQWAPKKADGQLELPSTSGTVPAQFDSSPDASCSTIIVTEDQEAVETRREEQEPLEQEKNMEEPEKDKPADTLEEEKNTSSYDFEEMPKRKTDICLIKLDPQSEFVLPGSSSSITPFE